MLLPLIFAIALESSAPAAIMPSTASSSVTIDREACTVTTSKGTFPLHGKWQVVTSFPDIKIQIVEAFEDADIEVVEAFPDHCGQVRFVDAFPDVKVQFVDAFPDIKIKFVKAFPGIKR